MFTKKSLIVSGALVLGLVCTGVVATYAQTVTPTAKKSVSIPLQLRNQHLLNVLNIAHYLGNQGLIKGSELGKLVGDLENLLLPTNQITVIHMPAIPNSTGKPPAHPAMKKPIKRHLVKPSIRPVPKRSSSSASTCNNNAQPSSTQQKQSTCAKQPVEAQQPGKQTPVVTQQPPK